MARVKKISLGWYVFADYCSAVLAWVAFYLVRNYLLTDTWEWVPNIRNWLITTVAIPAG